MNLRRQYLTQNDCYRAGRSIRPRGVMLHSTGADNPAVARYVPGDAVLGRNTAGNHWDQSNEAWRQKYGGALNKCAHAFIGLFADGSVGSVQTLPWTTRGWHAGGAANDTHIGIEICEDGLTDRDYFDRVCREAAELTAYLCGLYGLDPLEDGVVICHAEGYARGTASNHADVLHWFGRFGKTMDEFRADVAELLADEAFRARFERLRETLRDNDHGSWSGEALAWAVDSGLFSGAPGTDGQINYMWEDLLTREQLAVVLYRFAQIKGLR